MLYIVRYVYGPSAYTELESLVNFDFRSTVGLQRSIRSYM